MLKRIAAISIVLTLAISTVLAGVYTVPDTNSPTGYTTFFSYEDKAATNVQLVGSFQFYENNDPHVFANGFLLSAENDSINNYFVAPEDWTADKDLRHANDEGYRADMHDMGNGIWTYMLQLPSASYMYFFSVSYDNGQTWETVIDPDNVPEQNALSMNPQYRAKFFVPYDSSKQNPADDWTWLMPIEDRSKAGTIDYITYTGVDGVTRPAQVYLPAGYSASRPEPYKTLYMSHGTGGFEGDWFHQGNVDNIADRLIADGVIEPFVIVAVENNGLIGEGNTPMIDLIHDDVVDCLIPYIEENYNVSESAADRGFCGLSRGGRITSSLFMFYPEDFAYYAPLSGGATNLYSSESVDLEGMKKADLYLGAGFIDNASLKRTINQEGDNGTISFAWLMDSIGVDYNDNGSAAIVPGAHDWFTWPQLVLDYFTNYLWK